MTKLIFTLASVLCMLAGILSAGYDLTQGASWQAAGMQFVAWAALSAALRVDLHIINTHKG
jgi:hypothetical protein